MRLNFIVFLFTLFFASSSWAFSIAHVKIQCQENLSCVDYEGKFDDFKGEWPEAKLREKIKLLAFDTSIQKLAFEILDESEGATLIVKMWPRKLVGTITFSVTPFLETAELKKLIPFKEGEYYDDTRDSEAYKVISRFLSERGYAQENIELALSQNGNNLDLNYKIRVGRIVRIHEVFIDLDTPSFLLPLKEKFKKLRGQTWDAVQFKVLLEEASHELFTAGYVFSKVELAGTDKRKNGEEVDLKIKGKLGERYLFSFVGNQIFSVQELAAFTKQGLKELAGNFDGQELTADLKREYEKVGIYNTQIDFSVMKGKDRFQAPLNTVVFTIREGGKIPVVSERFAGNLFFKDEDIRDYFFEEGSVLTQRGFLDLDYLNKFPQMLQNRYASQGFVLAEVSPPLLLYNEKRTQVELEYKIKEKDQCLLQDLLVEGVPEELKAKVLSVLKNKKGKPLDTTILQDDLLAILLLIRNEGYYFARLENVDSPELLNYSPDATSAILKIKIDSGKKVVLGDILVTGNQRTRNKAILREIDLKRGEIITPDYLEELKEKLTSLGLFSFVRISLMPLEVKASEEKAPANLLIQLKERDFKTLELAPGYRTDLGAKLSTRFINNNIGGMNRTFTLQAQSNLRMNSNSFDERRQKDNTRLLEYQAEVSFLEPYLFSTAVESESSALRSRKRFHSFDADISRISTQLSKTYWKNFNVSLKYQLETISQFNATAEKDSGYFRIGGMTPAISLDLRDNKVNPRKGAFLGLSWEFANPYFYSMRDEDIEINFYRLISRNKFYIPLTKSWNIATSLAWGQERNLSTALKDDGTGHMIKKGYIPGIKVFRLDGIDTVRGFGDSEINRLHRPGQPDISEIRIENAAYFTSFKFEPRYLFNDTTMLGLFFDAGRVYVDKFEPFDLKTSAGLSFKILTPVGSLDFDYGVKLKREVTDAKQKESFGHFHLSIGYF